ncbi:MAG: BMP family ABC transporter substrate-binding protein [Bifidobacteriaceae bacterium]|jgi:basic membrane protein A|nr:BMP family ABC transporter substrate-binding protein [Bifidobacteriaceae bacterium]
MKKLLTSMGALALALTLVGCGDGGEVAPSESETPAPSESSQTPAASGLYCVVSDGGGFEDKSFNQSAKDGVEQAKTELGVEAKEVESKAAEDYQPNIDAAIAENCNIIFTVGFNLADATKVTAEAKPEVKFGIIDDSSINLPNVKPIVFNTSEAGYLAGYLAAGVSKNGVVATYGGLAIPSVQIFSDGFYQGVEAYNKAKSASVKVLGWDPENTTDGYQIVGDFTDQTKGKQITETFINSGADVILPVAGGAGLGTAQACAEKGCKYIWVDVDGYNTNDASYLPYLLTSVMKNITPAVFDVVKQDTQGTFSNEKYIGTIANGGVDIAPYHDLDSEVPAELKAEVDKLREDIKSGTLKIESQFSPAS